MWGELFVLLALSYVLCDVALDPLVVTPQGSIKGLRDDDNFSIFLGIPYARINEDNPFGVAEPHPPFESIFEAYEDPPACPQMLNNKPIGNLDCLRLNIFVPKSASSRNKVPVIVWLHGGAFITGSTKRYNYGGSNLVKHDVIVVTLNYRLGVYGFMCLDTPDVPGNQGFKDQLIALRWIKDNIASFGGDVSKITLMGESSGSASVEAHLLSKSEKLFNNAILQSGTLLKPQVISTPDSNVPLKVAKHLGFKTENISKALTFLSKTDPKLVIVASAELAITSRPCLEKEFDDVEGMITTMPYKADVPNVKGVNILAGNTDREALLMDAFDPFDYLRSPNYFRDTLESVFNFNDTFDEMIDTVRNFYIADANLTEVDKNLIIDFKSDFFYNYPSRRSLEELLKHGAGNIYQYMFSFDGKMNYIKNFHLNITLGGACHGDEIGYLFVMRDTKITPSATDQKVTDRMTTMWTNFAKYGNPIPCETDLLPVTWKPITAETVPCMNIDSELNMISRPFYSRLAFWQLFYTANKHRLKD